MLILEFLYKHWFLTLLFLSATRGAVGDLIKFLVRSANDTRQEVKAERDDPRIVK
jgi:hypothetical protein